MHSLCIFESIRLCKKVTMWEQHLHLSLNVLQLLKVRLHHSHFEYSRKHRKLSYFRIPLKSSCWLLLYGISVLKNSPKWQKNTCLEVFLFMKLPNFSCDFSNAFKTTIPKSTFELIDASLNSSFKKKQTRILQT